MLFFKRQFVADEIAAVLKLDNVEVARTSWRGCSQQAWDQRFSIQLEKSRLFTTSAADPRHFDVDPDPRIHASD